MAAYRLEILGGAQMARHSDAWRRLTACALESNIFFEPGFAAPALALERAGAVEFCLLWRIGPAPELALLWPMEKQRATLWRRGWRHDYLCVGAPLVARDEAEAAIDAFLGFWATQASVAVLIFGQIALQGRFYQELSKAAARRGLTSGWINRERRALLDLRKPPPPYSAKRRKEWARLRRRLGAIAPLRVAIDGEREAIHRGLKIFLELEARGWKGRDGGALAQRPGHSGFLQRMGAELATDGKCRIYRLTCGKRTLACHILIGDAATGYFWKTAYDEAFGKFSPGLLLTLDMTDALHGDSWRPFIDSCARPGHSMIDGLWRDRRRLGDLAVATRPGARRFLRALIFLEQWRRLWRERAKIVVARLFGQGRRRIM